MCGKPHIHLVRGGVRFAELSEKMVRQLNISPPNYLYSPGTHPVYSTQDILLILLPPTVVPGVCVDCSLKVVSREVGRTFQARIFA